MGEIIQRMMKKHAEENPVSSSSEPAAIVTKLNERRKAGESGSALPGDRRRYRLASTAPHFNRSTLGGE